MNKTNTWQDKAIGAWLVIISIFQLYTASVGIFQPRIQRGIHLMFLLPAAFVLFPAFNKERLKVGIGNWILALLSIFPPLYIVVFYERLTERMEFVDEVLPIELILGTMMILLLLEAVRRAVVPAMAMLIAGAFAYLYAAPYLSGVFYAKPLPFAELIEMQYLITDAGIFGSITGVSATFVALFVIFGAFMEVTKTGQFFTDLACRVAGKSNGGPAKIAVISSGLFGSISGVAAANVYSTGVFTIPLMKKLGYRRRFAGAVEAAASTGGMLMPPVMGAGAFVMAEITGISYVNIVIAAMLGSLLLYASMVIRVHYTAKKENLSGVTETDIISYKQLLRDSYLLIPMIFLVVMLLRGYSPFLAANAAIGVTFFISFFKKDTRMTPTRIWETLSLAGRNMIMIALACAGAGMVVAIVTPHRPCPWHCHRHHQLVRWSYAAGHAADHVHLPCHGYGASLHSGLYHRHYHWGPCPACHGGRHALHPSICLLFCCPCRSDPAGVRPGILCRLHCRFQTSPDGHRSL